VTRFPSGSLIKTLIFFVFVVLSMANSFVRNLQLIALAYYSVFKDRRQWFTTNMFCCPRERL